MGIGIIQEYRFQAKRDQLMQCIGYSVENLCDAFCDETGITYHKEFRNLSLAVMISKESIRNLPTPMIRRIDDDTYEFVIYRFMVELQQRNGDYARGFLDRNNFYLLLRPKWPDDSLPIENYEFDEDYYDPDLEYEFDLSPSYPY